uniref:ShKT domain-containing protein n=1 Tax=Globodera pallida TaxID=36090 RepID=A0A183BZZ0_GLOPA
MSSHKHLLILFEVLAFCTFLWGRSLRERLQRNPKLPPLVGNEPLKVFCGIYIESLGNFRAAEMSFDADLYLYLSWQDPSLNHSDFDYVLLNDPKIRHYIWLPDLYFANSRTSRFHEVIAPNLNLFIDRNGTIAYSTRITLSVACNLELSLYPMDSQKCAIQMLSYIQLPEFKIVNLTNEYCDGIYNYAIMEHSFKRDKFSCLEAIIHLNRQIGYHVVQSFIPTGMIVMISWVSFWIDRRAVPARVTLSFTTLLSLSTLGNGLRFGLPQVAYAKAIDFWFGACMFFVFLSLLEFAAVNSYMREAEKYERFANYYAKKNSVTIPPGRAPPKGGPSPMISRIPTPLPQRGPMFFDSSTQNSWERAKPAIIDYNKLPSIDASSSESDESPTLKWSSAANVGENNPVWFSVDEQPPQRSPPLKMKKEEKKEFAKISRVLPAITVDRTESGRKKHNNNNNASSASSKTQPSRDVNPMVSCYNEHECCATWTNKGECQRNPSYMNAWCKASCKQCQPDYSMATGGEKEFAKISRVLPAITVDRTESGRKKHNNNNNASSASSKTQPPRDVNPMATNHFLHEGFRCSRKGLSIDLNSRWLFPTAFTIWNLLYWGYYLWYIQPPTKSISL